MFCSISRLGSGKGCFLGTPVGGTEIATAVNDSQMGGWTKLFKKKKEKKVDKNLKPRDETALHGYTNCHAHYA